MKLFDLSNKTVLIVGASSGMGKRFAQIFSQVNARVILSSRREAELNALSTTIHNSKAIKMDISDEASVKKAFNHLTQENEKIDVVVCSAGIGGLTPIFDTEKNSHFQKIIQTNLMGVWYVTQQAAIHMKENNIAGSIILVSSINGTNRVRANISAYAASKAAVIHLAKTLTGELGEHNIRINAIAPGLVRTPMSDYKLTTPESREEMKKTIPLSFVAEPEDLDGTILYLASNKASRYVTGTCLKIDGGASWGGHGDIQF